MSPDREQEIKGGLERSIESLRKEGTSNNELSTSLLVQIISDLGITNARNVDAERQRHDIGRKLDRVMEKQEGLSGVLDRLEALEKQEALNTQFRHQFAGAGVFGKFLWAAFGGLIIWLIQHLPWGGR